MIFSRSFGYTKDEKAHNIQTSTTSNVTLHTTKPPRPEPINFNLHTGTYHSRSRSSPKQHTMINAFKIMPIPEYRPPREKVQDQFALGQARLGGFATLFRSHVFSVSRASVFPSRARGASRAEQLFVRAPSRQRRGREALALLYEAALVRCLILSLRAYNQYAVCASTRLVLAQRRGLVSRERIHPCAELRVLVSEDRWCRRGSM